MAENIQVQDITENDYSIQKAGEEVDALLDKATEIDAMNSQLSYTTSIAIKTQNTVDKMHFGTVEYKLTEAKSMVQIPLKLGFTPKQIIPSLRKYGTPNPYLTFCTTVAEYSGSLAFIICMGKNDGPEILDVPAGTYYVDYIAIE